jgi:hypothetical protein
VGSDNCPAGRRTPAAAEDGCGRLDRLNVNIVDSVASNPSFATEAKRVLSNDCVIDTGAIS